MQRSTFEDYKNGTHVYDVRTTSEYIVRGGRTDYKILIPVGSSENKFISAAANDLKFFFSEATGITLEVVEDDKASASGKYLAIHSTRLFSAQSVGVDAAELGIGGFRIKTVNGSVVMCGATEEASMYAMYSFLKVALGYDYYYTDFYKIDRNVTDLKLMNYDVTDVPDFQYRIQSTGWIRYNAKNRRRMLWTENDKWMIPVDEKSAAWHNTFNYLPKEQYLNSHPKWYSDQKTQLCYTAHGDAAERAEMIKIVSERIEYLFSLEKYRDYRYVSISIEDNQDCCACDACKAEKAKYGADSGVIVKFCNDVAKKVSAWMETPEGKPYKRDFRILFFAYHATNAAPVIYDERLKKYVPASPDVVCDDHVAVYFADTNGDYMANFHDENTANTVLGKNMRGWGALSKEIYFWSYSANFRNLLIPYNSFDTVQDILKFAKRENAVFIMIQDQWIQPTSQTGFGIFKNWLHAKLEWNVNADVNALAKEFFDGYFMEASDTMLELFNEWIVWARHQTKDLGNNGYRSVYLEMLKKELWQKEKLERWIALTERAESEISVHRDTDRLLFAQLTDHIATEALAFRYLLVELYGEEYSPDALAKIKNTFAADVSRIGISLTSTLTHSQVYTLLWQWGL